MIQVKQAYEMDDIGVPVEETGLEVPIILRVFRSLLKLVSILRFCVSELGTCCCFTKKIKSVFPINY